MDLSKLRSYINEKTQQGKNTVSEDIEDFINTDRSKITKAITSAYETIDTLAAYAREKSDSFIEILSNASVDELCNFNTKNGIFMLRLMHLNEQEKEITLNALGVDAMFNGNSHVITNAAQSPSYAKNMNYKDNFVKKLSENNINETTQTSTGTKADTYGEIINLYPDDDNSGDGEFTTSKKWQTKDINSLLYKTKKLFNQHKINTIISRFHTSPNTPISDLDAQTKFGLSHGRNLLTASAEKGGDGYTRNGYNNPYCRVWTHHYQYDRLSRLIRPFTNRNGEESKLVTMNDFHEWKNFKTSTNFSSHVEGDGTDVVVVGHKSTQTAWKSNNDAWKYSVMGNNGFLNITPKYQSGGGSNNIHTKQCMFSIENLAWRDYNPYKFENTLSWEQRGPMGGRIMWFPPYGLSFNETTSAQWVNNTFIGRGEDVYTYANTVRTGTLNFMLVVDHPSIVDYVSWAGRNQDGSDKVSDTDIHRFFAGCDDIAGKNGSNKKGGKLSDYAVPTPLTDEYLDKSLTGTYSDRKKPKDETTVPSTESEIKVTFYVFFPNNYSGWLEEHDSEGTVDNIAYLLYGKGAQYDHIKQKDLPLSFQQKTGNEGSGYEMSKPIEREENNFIQGKNTKWYYRINKDTKDQVLYDTKTHKHKIDDADEECYHLNASVKAVREFFIEEKDNPRLYSFSDIALCLCKNEEVKETIRRNAGIENDNTEKVNTIENGNTDEAITLKNLLNEENGYLLTSINVVGYSSVDDINKAKHNLRNNNLASQRASAINSWIAFYKDAWSKIPDHTDYVSERTDNTGDNTTNGKDSKKYRSAKVVLTFNAEKTEKLSDTEQKPEINLVDIWNLAKEIQVELREKNIIPYSQEIAENIKEEKLTSLINAKISEGKYINSIEETLRTIKDVFNVEVQHATFEIEEDVYENLKSSIQEKVIGNKVLNIFDSEEEFEKTLGKIIEKQITKLSAVQDVIKKDRKDLNKYNKIDSKNQEILSAIDINNKNIDNIENKQIPELENKISETVKERSYIQGIINGYQNKKDEYQQIVNNNKEDIINGIVVSVKDARHEINKLNNKISEYNKQITELEKVQDKLNNDKKKLSEQLLILKENNKKLNSQLKENDENIKSQETIIDIEDNEENVKYLKNVIKDYIKTESDVDDYYLDSISKDFATFIYQNIDVIVRFDNYLTDSDGNVLVDEDGYPIIDKEENNINSICEVIFKNDPYLKYNKLIVQYTDEENKVLIINENEFRDIITHTKFKFIGVNEEEEVREEDKKIFSIKTNNGDNVEYGYSYIPFSDEWIKKMIENLNSNENKENINWYTFKDVLDKALKKHMWLYYAEIDDDMLAEAESSLTDEINKIQEGLDSSEYINFSKHIDENGKVYYINENEDDPELKGRRWIEDKEKGCLVLEYIDNIKHRADGFTGVDSVLNNDVDSNKVRFDQEYHFFRVLKEKDRMTYDKLMNKIQYFDPAFHSMTPEGFSARLTFLQQCMRQGDTVSASDNNAKSANNLAFGRPPYCILRLGDFYNQMIVIDNISINYDPLTWDLNTEGAGVIPLIANVSMSFKFIGGGSMYGAVNRLQNAMSFNYYANTNLYDNRSDRPRYEWDDKTNGAINHGLLKDSYFHSVPTYTPKN